MKKELLLFTFVVIHLTGICQKKDESIIICKNLELIKISESAYIHVSYNVLPHYGRVSANGLILINKNNAFLFDTPGTDSLTMVLINYLKEHMGLSISGFIPNHWHSDCMGGLGYVLSQNIESYANQKTIENARKEGLPLAKHSFQDSLRLLLDDKIIDCYFPGAAHTTDNIVVWIPSEKILFPGCMIKSLNSTDLGNVADGDLNAYPATIEKLIRKFKTAEIVIPGHGKAGSLDLLYHTRDLTLK
jgi:metallo-beta-lactamase class B